MSTINVQWSYSTYCLSYDRGCLDRNIILEQSIKSSNFNYSMEQLQSMVNIDLSNNFLVGIIPSEITKLKRLIGLNLSHNNLTQDSSY